MSLYPDIFPPDDAHPTADHFEIVETGDGRGRGVRVKAPFPRGARVALLSGIIVNRPMLQTYQIAPTLHSCDPWFAQYFLHSCDPNLMIDVNSLQTVALRDIPPGEFLTIDYVATEDYLSRQFECLCGAPNCRRWMMGRREQPNEEGRAFLARLAASRQH